MPSQRKPRSEELLGIVDSSAESENQEAEVSAIDLPVAIDAGATSSALGEDMEGLGESDKETTGDLIIRAGSASKTSKNGSSSSLSPLACAFVPRRQSSGAAQP